MSDELRTWEGEARIVEVRAKDDGTDQITLVCRADSPVRLFGRKVGIRMVEIPEPRYSQQEFYMEPNPQDGKEVTA